VFGEKSQGRGDFPKPALILFNFPDCGRATPIFRAGAA